MKSRLGFIAIVGLAFVAGFATGQPYPSRPVKLVVPFPPGGPTDAMARVLAHALSPRVGQPVVVDNRPGAGGTIGAEAAAKSAADGYTLFLGTTGTLASAPGLYTRLGYDPARSFSPISLLAKAPFLIVIHPTVPAASLREFIALAKEHPGQLSYASAGLGNPLHIAGEMFKSAAGVKLLHVPYKGAGPAIADLLAARVQVMFEQPAALLPHIRSGKLRPLAVTDNKRHPQLPDVPTTEEAGLAGYELTAWTGVVAPQGTSEAIVGFLNSHVRQALGDQAVREALSAYALQPIASSPKEFAAFIMSEAAKWGRAIQQAGIKAE